MPKQRLLCKSCDLHLGKELTSRITRFQPVLHTGKEPMVVYIVAGVLCVGNCCSCYMEGKDESDYSIRPLNGKHMLSSFNGKSDVMRAKTHHSLKSPVCWCVSITLPASS